MQPAGDHGGESQMGDVGHAGEGLAAEAEGLDAGEIFVILQLALLSAEARRHQQAIKRCGITCTRRRRELEAHRRESFDGDCHVFFPDSMPVVCDLQQF